MLLTLLLALALAFVHLAAAGLPSLGRVPRSRSLSLAGGAAVAYVFLHVLPELSAGQQTLQDLQLGLVFLEHHAYLLALAGLVVFYGLERVVVKARKQEPDRAAPPAVFWLHVGSFGLYNVLVGYLLVHRIESDVRGLLLFTLAMGAHFLVNDFGLRAHHAQRYDRQGRYVLGAAVLIGWGLAQLRAFSEPVLALLFAVLAGSVVLNVLKEELPEERESRFGAFLTGCVGYALLLLLSA